MVKKIIISLFILISMCGSINEGFTLLSITQANETNESALKTELNSVKNTAKTTQESLKNAQESYNNSQKAASEILNKQINTKQTNLDTAVQNLNDMNNAYTENSTESYKQAITDAGMKVVEAQTELRGAKEAAKIAKEGFENSPEKKNLDKLVEENKEAQKIATEQQKMYDATPEGKAAIVKAKADAVKAAAKAKADHEEDCSTGEKKGKCLEQPTFVISMKDTIGVGFEVEGNTSQVINRTLGTIIQKLMVALGVLSVLIMTVGAGYIIMYHGQDELLSKGKSIFMSGVTALIVALSSYYIVSILRFILYN